MSIELERPLRNPDVASAPLMDKRARWLVVLGFVLPGSAQVLAGNRPGAKWRARSAPMLARSSRDNA